MKTSILTILIFVFVTATSIAQGEWTHITEINGLEIGNTLSLVALDNGDIWFSSFIFDNNNTLHCYVFHLSDGVWINESGHFDGNDVNYIANAPNGDMYFSYGKTLVKYDGTDWNYKEAPNNLATISIDDQGIVWCGSSDGYLKLQNSEWNSFDGPIPGWPAHVKVSPEGVPWVKYGDPYATDGQEYKGVYYFDGEEWIVFNEGNGFPANEIDDIVFGPDDKVYVSYGPRNISSSGISRYDGVEWEQLTTKSGKLTFDPNSQLWVTVRFDGHLVYRYDGMTWKEYRSDSPVFMSGHTAVDTDGRVWIGTNDGILILDPTITAVKENKEQKVIPLLQNYPNPFNAKTTISFSLQNAAYTTLNVYSISGQNVATLVDEQMVAGDHAVVFDGTGLGSGMYIVQFTSNDIQGHKKIQFLK